MCLINPLTRARITLPPRNKFDDVVQYRPNQVDEEYIIRMWYDKFPYGSNLDEEYVDEQIIDWYFVNVDLIWKVVLSSAPSDECVVVAIYGQSMQLAWCRLNDDKWTHIYACIAEFKDIIFHNGKLYGITNHGKLYMFENIGTCLNPKVTEIASGLPIPHGRAVYLAEWCSDGGLMVVGRHFEVQCNKDSPCPTIGFTVYKIDSLNSTWIELKNIGSDVLVLGYNSSVLISSDQLRGHKGNLIYFTDYLDMKTRNYELDMGVFKFDDGTVELLPGFCPPIWPRPIWINMV